MAELVRSITPLEAGDPEPVWCGGEEKGPAYETFFLEYLRWRTNYSEYNGYAKFLKEEREKIQKERKYYKFYLGEEGQKKFDDFIEKYRNNEYKIGMYPPGAYYVFIIEPTQLGDVVKCEVRKADKYGDITILDECQVYSEL